MNTSRPGRPTGAGESPGGAPRRSSGREGASRDQSSRGEPGGDTRMGDVFSWALEVGDDPAMAAANWLARDIDPKCESAVTLVTDPMRPIQQLINAKHVFKTLRIVGETAADRRLGGRLYAASIAAALAYHGKRITTQSDAALRRGLTDLKNDFSLPPPLREVAELALRRFNTDT